MVHHQTTNGSKSGSAEKKYVQYDFSHVFINIRLISLFHNKKAPKASEASVEKQKPSGLKRKDADHRIAVGAFFMPFC
jgi:hypothetical protein